MYLRQFCVETMENLITHVNLEIIEKHYPESKILVIYTGGTIGMSYDETGGI